MRLYLTDSESRKAGEGTLLVVRPRLPDTRSEFAPWKTGDVLLGREAWAPVYNCPARDCEPGADGCTHRRVLYRATDADAAKGYVQTEDGADLKWRPAPQMSEADARHHLRVVRVECRQISSVTMDETIQAGCKIYVSTDGCPEGKVRPMIAITGRFPACKFMPKGKPETWEEADYHRATYASEWMERHGKKAPWPDGWAWFISTERAL